MLDQPRGNAGIQQAEVFDVERHLFLVLPGGEELGGVVVGAQQPGAAPRIPHLAPLADQLAGVPLDPLARLFVQVQPDAVDVRGDFSLCRLQRRQRGSESVPDFAPLNASATTGSE